MAFVIEQKKFEIVSCVQLTLAWCVEAEYVAVASSHTIRHLIMSVERIGAYTGNHADTSRERWCRPTLATSSYNVHKNCGVVLPSIENYS